MSYLELLNEYNALPPNYKREVEDFVLFLKAKANSLKNVSNEARVLGGGKNMIAWIASDFDAPLDDMKEYME